jgi:glycosyltransferase involved in cell wall biosynthesis
MADTSRQEPSLRTLLWMPTDRRVLGGHINQLERTARALRDLGCDVRESYSDAPRFDELDIVHGFSLEADQIATVRRLGLPVVLSTIYWNLDYRSSGPEGTPTMRAWAGRARRSGRFALASLRGRGALARVCMAEVESELRYVASYSAADLLLPNAIGEAESIRADLQVRTPTRFVPNGVDPVEFPVQQGTPADRDKVLMAARIEPHKNQLGLLEALRDSGLRVVVAGYPHPAHLDYLDRCRAASAGWAELVEAPSTPELSELFRSARVHVLPSWFETTGLVSLEAGLSGCNVVSTDRGYAREYLGDLAWYCDPADPASIRTAVRQAWDSPPSPLLREKILANYTWAHAGAATLGAYREAIAMRSCPRS